MLFGIIHRITTTHEAITQITREVVQDFSEDGCTYVELRTTPKVLPRLERVFQGSYPSSWGLMKRVWQDSQGSVDLDSMDLERV